MSDLLFLDKVSPNANAFAVKVQAIANRLGVNPNWLMGVMNQETGGTFAADVFNMAGSGAVGLIQILPSTAKDLGTTVIALSQMSNLEQLDYVEKYLRNALRISGADRIQDYDDLYLLVFYPAAVGKPDGWAFPYSIYSKNLGMDMNKDGKITINDFRSFIRSNIPASAWSEFVSPRTKIKWLAFSLVCITSLFLIFGYIHWKGYRLTS